ncbi:hypothetical protein ASPVEDRAFT_83602 [Aspergillus versicolor CBS 583.65]|uniref:CENP-V/GFA domain-containing protein n=1 Tax=Aspergillus versicolor CBS 583.65 TaxID=1036611 RepID=A0A1L9PKS8_ASPVE|nr:uncharacterized protein ASPVEDRAFT_83602 [Aspergillus versicolor CBS 583.65]OJJ02082.1 hypothetical protein ASPVEDRAFT_83602 [Aspergillus versicolor CBS 583.65]
MTSIVVGSCYCGKSRYETTAPIYGLSYCYCTICQLVHGAPFAPFVNIKSEHFHWIEKTSLVELRLTDFATRTVCSSCHAPLTMVYDKRPQETGICAVTVKEGAVPELECHIFVETKPEWYRILDDKPQDMGVPEDMKQYLT